MEESFSALGEVPLAIPLVTLLALIIKGAVWRQSIRPTLQAAVCLPVPLFGKNTKATVSGVIRILIASPQMSHCALVVLSSADDYRSRGRI